jgi:hypothetical protein
MKHNIQPQNDTHLYKISLSNKRAIRHRDVTVGHGGGGVHLKPHFRNIAKQILDTLKS